MRKGLAEFERPEEAEWPPWANYLREAWSTLQQDRSLGFGGVGGLWHLSAMYYANIHGFEGDELDDFLHFMRVLDSEYIKHCDEQAKTETEKRRDK